MTQRSVSFAVVLLALTATASAQGQDNTSASPVLAVGSRVRITSTATPGRTRGMVQALDESVVTLATDTGVIKMPLTSITALDVSLGRKRNWLKGAAIGLVGGLILGSLTPLAERDVLNGSDGTTRGEAIAGGAFTGVLFGAGIGAVIRTERWSKVTLSAAQPRVQNGGRAVGLVAAVRF